MRYQITKENIEFEVDEKNLTPLVVAVIKVLIPRVFKKLYFSGLQNKEYSKLHQFREEGLVILTKDNDSTLLKKERIIHRDGYVILVPVLSGIVKHKEWQPICEKIVNEYQAIV